MIGIYGMCMCVYVDNMSWKYNLLIFLSNFKANNNSSFSCFISEYVTTMLICYTMYSVVGGYVCGRNYRIFNSKANYTRLILLTAWTYPIIVAFSLSISRSLMREEGAATAYTLSSSFWILQVGLSSIFDFNFHHCLSFLFPLLHSLQSLIGRHISHWCSCHHHHYYYTNYFG